MTQAEQRDVSRKLRILNHAKQTGNVSQTCRYFGISREIFYRWKRAYEKDGERALVNSKPCPPHRPFVCFDNELAEAAKAEGFEVHRISAR